MDINSIVDKLNNQLDKLNNIKNGNSINTNDFFTDDETFNDDLDLSAIKEDSSSTIVSENKR
ncbi:MAG: hypothetical protein ACI4XR_02915 [Bacilli bacterium]